MEDGERLVAEQEVQLHQDRLVSVRISEHRTEEFWRVDVASPSARSAPMTATVATADSFLMHLISGAVRGEETAWRHLAEWGHDNLTRATSGFRLAPAFSWPD